MLLFADGVSSSEQQVRDEAMTMFLAGHDTLGNALAWTLYLLSQHPRTEAAWHRELRQVLQDRLPTAEDLDRLEGTQRLFKESMRLFPPVWSFGRQARVSTTIDGVAVPPGTIVQASQWLLHRDPRFYPEPSRFMPNRWTREFEKSLPKGAYIPFGIGTMQNHTLGSISCYYKWLA